MMIRWLAPWLLVLGCTSSTPVAVSFRAVVGQRPFVCGERYAGVGALGGSVSFSDLRMYVSEPRLIDAAGREHALQLTQDARQSTRVALLEFVDAGRACTGQIVSPPLRGTSDVSAASGIAFELGVPFEDNHQDPAAARAPFDVSSMFWVWRHGYKFLRLEALAQGAEGPRPLSVHVGSTGCSGEAPTDRPASCARPNRARVRLANFDPRRDSVEFDLAELLAQFSLPATGAGCESAPDDPDCIGVFAALGLSGSRGQRVFRVGKGAR